MSESNISKPVSENKSETNSETRSDQISEKVARDMRETDPKGQKGNGNNYELDETKSGSAQTGGPGIDRARENQPPDATRTK